ncbi:MAG: sulfite exporter TauE/SafE family protein [Syntrophobacteraceae bacterium]
MSFGGFDFFPFVVGMLGSVHCLGMCGMLVLASSLPKARCRLERGNLFERSELISILKLQVLFHLGRLATYAVAGAVAAGFFTALRLTRVFQDAYAPATIIGGILLMVSALAMAGLLPFPDLADRLLTTPLSAILSRAPSLIQSPKPGAKFLLGLLTGLLPCCLSWAMVVTAASTLDPIKGFWTMLCFGLGTVPALLAAALFGLVLSVRARLAGERLSALVIGCMGIALIFRGFGILR